VVVESSPATRVAEAARAYRDAQARWNEISSVGDAELHEAVASELLAARLRFNVAVRESRREKRGLPATAPARRRIRSTRRWGYAGAVLGVAGLIWWALGIEWAGWVAIGGFGVAAVLLMGAEVRR
jgi:hypothetical protein